MPTAANGFHGILEIPVNARSLIVFAHGLDSSHRSPRNCLVARSLFQRGFAICQPDLTDRAWPDEKPVVPLDRSSILQTGNRLISVIDWLRVNPTTSGLRIGMFGARTGAAAAMIATARRPHLVESVVCRGGRPDLGDDVLPEVQAPILMLVGSKDHATINHNTKTIEKMHCKPMLEVIQGANHLFAEPGKLELVASIAYLWYLQTMERKQVMRS